jgi:ribosome biogenesis GTPase A
VEIFNLIGEKKSLLMGNREIDYDRVTDLIIRDIRNEKFGPLSLERP